MIAKRPSTLSGGAFFYYYDETIWLGLEVLDIGQECRIFAGACFGVPAAMNRLDALVVFDITDFAQTS